MSQAKESRKLTRHAIIIGVDRCPRSLNLGYLQYAKNDALAMQEMLRENYGFTDITFLPNEEATKQAIRMSLLSLANPKVVSTQDEVVIFFSGHGKVYHKPKTGGEIGFLVPYDGQALDGENNLGIAMDSCLSMDELKVYLEAIPARHTIVLIDTCFSGFILPKGQELSKDANDLRDSIEVITAGTSSEITTETAEYKHGILTAALLDELGLRKKKSESFSALDIYGTISKRVIKDSRSKQHPQYARLMGEGLFSFHPNEAKIDAGNAKPDVDKHEVPTTQRSDSLYETESQDGYAYVSLRSEPSGAIINGNSEWKTPIRLHFDKLQAEKTVEFILRKEGYIPQSVTAIFKPGRIIEYPVVNLEKSGNSREIELSGHSKDVATCELSNSGRYAVSIAPSNSGERSNTGNYRITGQTNENVSIAEVFVWDLVSGTLVAKLPCPDASKSYRSASKWRVEFSSDESLIAATNGETVWFWSRSGDLLQYGAGAEFRFSKEFGGLFVAESFGQHLGTGTGPLSFWASKQGTGTVTLTSGCFAFNSGGTKLAISEAFITKELWKELDRVRVIVFQPNFSRQSGAHPFSSKVAWIGKGTGVRQLVWSVKGDWLGIQYGPYSPYPSISRSMPAQVATFNHLTKEVHEVRDVIADQMLIASDGTRVILYQNSGNLQFWDMRTGKSIASFPLVPRLIGLDKLENLWALSPKVEGATGTQVYVFSCADGKQIRIDSINQLPIELNDVRLPVKFVGKSIIVPRFQK